MQLGFEVELNYQNANMNTQKDICKKEGLSFTEFKAIEWHNILMKMSKEYYSWTIEFNYFKESFNKNLINKVKKHLKYVIKKYWLTVHWYDPSFVWTHIHFFRSNLENVNDNTILKYTLKFILDNVNDLHEQSIYRIIKSHQLWWNYAYTIDRNIKEILESKLGTTFAYSWMCSSKTKYRPVLRSPRTRTGKLKSTEIRIIPTELILNWKIYDFINELINIKEDNINKDVPTLYLELINEYVKRKKKSKN